MLEVLKGSWEVPGEAPGEGLGKLCRSLLEGSKGYWEAPREGPEKLCHSLLEVLEGSWEAPMKAIGEEAMPFVVGWDERLLGGTGEGCKYKNVMSTGASKWLTVTYFGTFDLQN